MTTSAISGATESKVCIPRQFEGCRFLRLGRHSKRPAPGQWGHYDSNTRNYGIDDPELLRHIETGGNYGVIPRGGVCTFDADSQTLWDAIPEEWKQSFTVKSGRETGDGRHLFLSCPDAPKAIKVIFPGKLGDIRLSGSRFYTVGPGSIHDKTGRPYTVVNDAPIIEVAWDDLSKFIEENKGEIDLSDEQKQITRKIRNTDSALLSEKYDLRPEDWIMPTNPKYVGNTIIGGNPIIGSTSGGNLHIHTGKGVFFDFHDYDGVHKKGGDGTIAYALAKGIISFDDLGPGCLSNCWDEVLSSLEEDGIKPMFECDFSELLNPSAPDEAETEENPAPSADETVKTLLKAAYGGQRGIADLFVKVYKGKFVFDHSAGQWYSFRDHAWVPEILSEQIRSLTPIQDAFKSAAFALEKELKTFSEEHQAKDKDDISKNDATAFKDKSEHLKADIKALRSTVHALDTLAYRKVVCEFASIGAEGIGLKGDEWDRDAWVLGCPNGIIDLKSGNLRDGTPGDYIRSVTKTPYTPGAECPHFESFLSEILGSDPELVQYMQRLLGMALIGDAALKQHVVMLIGRGRNGKDTLIKVVNRILGNSLCGKINSALLLDTGHLKAAGTASPEIMDLQGKRFVFASETGNGKCFDLARVKDLSGGGDLKGRVPYGKTEIQFKASHLIFLETNHKPIADASDLAFWYRVKCISFPFSFVPEPKAPFERQEIKGLSDTLMSEAEGILNWLVRGCLEYQRIGLADPDAVKVAVKEYRADVDVIGQFLLDICIVDARAEISATILYSHYKDWCESNNLKPLSGTRFGRDVSGRFGKVRKDSGNFYEGIGIPGGLIQ